MIRILSQLRAQSRTFRPAADRRICRLIHSLDDLGHKKTSPRIRPLYARNRTLSFAVAALSAQAAPGPEVEYEAVIGIETHVQLNTSTKAFCSCRNEYGAEPNSHICDVCLGHPGSLPVLNSDMVRLGVLAGLGLGTHVAMASNFDRKQYFYPDLPKGYQISQYGEPLCETGAIEFPMPDGSGTKRVGITRAHLEEDAGKLTHLGADALAGSAGSNVDFNRAGVPLLEIVSEPDLRTGQEAAAYGQEIRRIMRYLGVSNGNMAEGSLRCDVNVSVRPKGSETLGTKVEVKNMNSFSAMQKAIDFEISRQASLIKEGRADEVVQETRLFDEGRQETYTMRKKEGLADYRYFPEPDLPPLLLSQEYLDSVQSSMPELPGQKRTRYLEMGLKLKEVLAITDEATTAEYFDAVVAAGAAPKLANNWVMGDIVAHCKEAKISMSELAMSPGVVAEMIALIEDGTISGKIAKEVLPDLLQGNGNSGVKAFCESRGMVQISDPDAIGAIIDAVLESNPKQLEQFRGGKTKLQGFFVGQVMKESGGRVNPAVMNKLLAQKLQS